MFVLLAIVGGPTVGPPYVPLVAQQTTGIPSTAEIQKLLESSQPADQAWGCWWAAQAQARELAPAIEQVATANASRPWPAPAVTTAAIDSLIRLDVKVSVAFAESLFERRPVESLILASRLANEIDPFLVRVVDRGKNLAWLSALNLAVPRKPVGLAAILLQQAEIKAEVLVVSPGAQSIGFGGSGGGVMAGDGGIARLPGFPPLANYQFGTFGAPGAVVLAKGPRTVFYWRVQGTAGETEPANSRDEIFHKTPDIVAALAEMLRPGADLPIRAVERVTVTWSDQAALDRAIDAFRSEVTSRYVDLVRRLEASRALTAAEAATFTTPSLAVSLLDHRQSPTPPLVTRITDRAVATLTLPGSADFLAGDMNEVWITNRGRMEKLVRGQSEPVATVEMPRPCGAPVITDDSVWVANCSDQSLYRIDRKTTKVVATIPTGLADRSGELSIAASPGAIWLLTDAAGVLSRIEPRTNTVVARIEVAANSFAAAYDYNSDSVWISTTGARGAAGPGSVQRIDPATNKVVATVTVGSRPRFLSAGEGAIWTLNQGDGTVSRVDPKTNAVVATIDTGVSGGGGDIAAGNGRVWVRATRTLLQSIDPQTNRILEIFGPPAGSGAVRVAGDYVWVSAHDIQKVWVLPVR